MQSFRAFLIENANSALFRVNASDEELTRLAREMTSHYGADEAQNLYYSIKNQILSLISDTRHFSLANEYLKQNVLNQSKLEHWIIEHLVPELKAHGWPAKDSAELYHLLIAFRDRMTQEAQT